MGLARLAASVAALAVAARAGLYSESDGVVPLGDAEYGKKVLGDAAGFWFIEVYADWCGHCKAAVPAVKEAAKALKGVVNFGVVNGDTASGTAQRLGVQGFPTFKLLLGDKSKPIDYSGPREAAAMVEFALKEVAAAVRQRMGKKASGGGGGGGGGGQRAGGGGGGGHGGSNEPGAGKHVIKGTAANFQSEVYDSELPVLVEVYAPWCGHCKSLAAPLAEAAEELAGEVKVVAVDGTAEASVASDFGVRGYPTLKFFPPGKGKTPASAVDYNGGRDKESIVTALRAMAEAAGGAKVGAAVQLTGPAVWEEQCGGKRLCIVTFLPHILDENADKRNARLAVLAEVAGKVGKRSLFRFLWSEVGAQPALEEKLNVGMVPALFAVSGEKKVFSTYRGALDTGAVVKFVNSLSVSAGGATKLPAGVPAIATVPEWDGQDGQAAGGAEEMSLDELDL